MGERAKKGHRVSQELVDSLEWETYLLTKAPTEDQV